MANSSAGRTTVIDTAGTDNLRPGIASIARIFWAGSGIVAGDQLLLKDRKGEIIMNFFCSLNKQGCDINLPEGMSYDGLICETITHGTAYVVYRV